MSAIKKNILIGFYFMMTYSGIIKLFYWINRNNNLVITYHNIIPDELYDHTEHLGVSHIQSVFAAHLKLIKKRFSKHKKAMVNRCQITFDDGYKNQVEIASKMLNEHNLKATFFITFQLIKERCPAIIDKILMWMSYAPVGTYHILDDEITLAKKNRQSAIEKIYKKLMFDHKLWYLIENALDSAYAFEKLPLNNELARLRFEPLDEHDLITLKNDGHLLGAHSWSHFPLSILPLDVQKNDFAMCIDYARHYCNSMTYSYPFGGIEEVSPQTVNLCSAAGFTEAYMNMPKSPKWNSVNQRYILPRISLPNEKNRYLIDAKLSGFESFCKNFI